MNTLALVLVAALAVVCLGIPLAAVAVVYRDDLAPVLARIGRALAFDPRHPALDHRAR